MNSKFNLGYFEKNLIITYSTEMSKVTSVES